MKCQLGICLDVSCTVVLLNDLRQGVSKIRETSVSATG